LEEKQDAEQGIQTSNEETKQKIKSFLIKVNKTKLEQLKFSEASDLRNLVKPKCHSGHIIDNSGGSYKKCDSKRAGDKCLKESTETLCACYNEGCDGGQRSDHFMFCNVCLFWNE